MKIALRADASREQGTGHVMRCLTLAEAFTARGHSVTLIGSIGDIPWLWEVLRKSPVALRDCAQDALDVEGIVASEFDGVVVDSYQILPELISRLNEQVPCLAIIDGDARGINASLYVDQNLGAVMHGIPKGNESRWLGGSSYSLIRNAVLEHRRGPIAPPSPERAKVVAFMGGTDPSGVIVDVAASIVAQSLDIDVTLVSPPAWRPNVESAVATDPSVRVIEPTIDLPRYLGEADFVVSAAGTSAWDVCTMARPAVLIAVVDNQRASLSTIEREGVALVLDATADRTVVGEVGSLLASLINSSELQQRLMDRCLDVFDGDGKVRVVEAAEKQWAQSRKE